MKRYYLLLLFFGMGFPQATGLALFGIGEEILNTDPASLALGSSRFFTGNSINIASGSPSSLWRSALTRFTIHSGINYLTIPQLPEQFQHNLTHFSITFPIGIKKVFGFGLTPTFRTNRLEIKEDFQYIGADESLTGIPIAYKSHYFIDGGMSELFFQYSQKWTPHFSFGIKYSFLFGNQFLNDELYTYDVIIDTVFSQGLLIGENLENEDIVYIQAINENMVRIERSNKFSGNVFTIEGRYIFPHQEWVIRLSVNGNINVLTGITQTINNELFDNNFNYIASKSKSDIGLGYHFLYNENSGFIIEVHKNYKLNIPEEVALFNITSPHENSIHFGTYFQVVNPKFGLWNNINLRAGGYYKELDYDEDKYLDYGFTFGLGLEYLSNSQIFDLAIRAGKKESYILQDQYEKYISLHFGISTGEKWFMKRRRK